MLNVDIQLHHPHAGTSAFALEAQFTLLPGRCLGVMGPSGAGKTSLLHTIAGLLTPSAGRILHDYQPWFDAAQGISLPPWQRAVGLVFQEGRLFPHMSVLRNLQYGMPAQGAQIALDDVVEVLQLNALLARMPAQLSGGEQQRVAMGRALLRQPAVLLMDEPLSGLDEALKQQVLPYVRQVLESFALPTLYVSHVSEEVSAVADEVLWLAQGRLHQPASG